MVKLYVLEDLVFRNIFTIDIMSPFSRNISLVVATALKASVPNIPLLCTLGPERVRRHVSTMTHNSAMTRLLMWLPGMKLIVCHSSMMRRPLVVS